MFVSLCVELLRAAPEQLLRHSGLPPAVVGTSPELWLEVVDAMLLGVPEDEAPMREMLILRYSYRGQGPLHPAAVRRDTVLHQACETCTTTWQRR